MQEQRFVEHALDWPDPSVDGSRIAVRVDDGVVALHAIVATSCVKLPAATQTAWS